MPGRKLGVIGALVWDQIHGRDPAQAAIEEWGGIAYALASLDASLPEGWEIVPLIKVGRDLKPEADRFLASLARRHPSARFIEVPTPNNRVVLRYQSAERRCERMSGGVPGWNWAELGPLVGDLDAVYVNFISGFEMCLGTATALRDGFRGPIYADLHSLLLGMGRDGIRTLAPLPNAPNWYRCFDYLQVNEDEMAQLSDDPLGLATTALAQGVTAVFVTLGARGVVYLEDAKDGRMVRTELVPTEFVPDADPTGCGDVFGAAAFSAILGGASVADAARAGTRMAARNARYRGAGGLAQHLRGALVTP